MSTVTIYHNPRCSKSRQTLELLSQQGIEPEVVEYLQDVPDRQTLDRLLTMLGMEPEALVRKKEKVYKELDLANRQVSREEWLDILVEHPILIERPIVVNGNQARIGRPPEQVQEIL